MPCSNRANTFIQKTIYLLTEEANWLSYLILSLPNVSDYQILSLNNILSSVNFLLGGGAGFMCVQE